MAMETEQCEIHKVICILGYNYLRISLDLDMVRGLLDYLGAAVAKTKGFRRVFLAIIMEMSMTFPCAGSTICFILEDLPLPTTEIVLEFARIYDLSSHRAMSTNLEVGNEINICILLGCLAEKLVGTNSNIIFTNDIMEYLCTFLVKSRHPLLAVHALIALEKFAFTNDNRIAIQQHLANQPFNPLLKLELLANSDYTKHRQLGFCAKSALENTFTVAGRPPSYESVDMTNINVVMKANLESNLMRTSANGLEARNDTATGQGLRSTFEVKDGCWYYEAQIISEGLMEVGYATTDNDLLHDNPYMGINENSVGYDGCRRTLWFNGKGIRLSEVPLWKPGDILGCLLDIGRKEIIITLNGRRLPSVGDIFQTDGESRKKVFYAAACLHSFQHARFNFGTEPFAFPPTDRVFSAFNYHGRLTDEEKKIKPKLLVQREVLSRDTHTSTDTCVICYSGTPAVALSPCGHNGFCAHCAFRLTRCPKCRVELQTTPRERDPSERDEAENVNNNHDTD